MIDVSHLFSSRSKFKVLRTLIHHSSPLSLRHISYLSEESLFSIQRSLEQLVSQNLVFKKTKGQRVFFSINQHNPYGHFLYELFALEMKICVPHVQKERDKKAKSVLKFSQEAHRLVQKARS